MNSLIIHNLYEMYNLYRYRKETWKAKAYNEALQIIQKVDTPIDTVQDIHSLNLGKSIKEKVVYILEHKRNLPQLLDENDETFKIIHAIDHLSKVHNVGLVKATELVEKHGILSLDDLKKNDHLLNSKQKQGLVYHNDILQKIPKSEMDEHEQSIRVMVNKYFPNISDFSLVGSYRRNAKESGDIDLIVNTTSDIKMKDFVHVMITQGYIEKDGVFALGTKKFMGMSRIPNSPVSRRLDILFCASSEYAFALLYFTGSKEFNVKMRERAKQLGYRLNEKGLFGDDSTKVKNLTSEKDIFKFLKIKYVEPNERYVVNYQEY